MNLDHASMNGFLDALASGAATPGGGGAAAVMGAMGAGLISMVAHLTIGKKGFDSVDAEMHTLLANSELLRRRLTDMVAADASAFEVLMAAYRQPKSTDAEKAERSAAIQAGLQLATLAPLHCARACADVVRLAMRAVDKCKPQVISDVGVAALAAWAGLQSSALNVSINAPQIKDRGFVDEALRELAGLLEDCARLNGEVSAHVQRTLE